MIDIARIQDALAHHGRAEDLLLSAADHGFRGSDEAALLNILCNASDPWNGRLQALLCHVVGDECPSMAGERQELEAWLASKGRALPSRLPIPSARP